MNNIVDTLLNLSVFLFIGLLLWLYFKPVGGDDDDAD